MLRQHQGAFEASVPAKQLPPAVRGMWLVVLLLGVGNLLFCLVSRQLTHLGFANFFPLSNSVDRFGDFTVYWQKFRFFGSPLFFHSGFPFTYPAPVALAYDLFLHHAGPHPLAAFLGFSVFALLVPALWFAVALHRSGIAAWQAVAFPVTLLVFSWPAILVLDRANMEILVWIALAFATWAWSTGRGYLAATGFALAAALKLFPFVFFGLFLSTREFRKILFGAAVFLAGSVLALALVGPSVPVAYLGIQAGIAYFRAHYMAGWYPSESSVDHSLYGLYKTIAVLAGHGFLFAQSLSIYLVVIAITGVLLFFLHIRFLPLLNQLLCLSVASILFTAFSGDGTLLHLYYPLALLVFLAIGAWRADHAVPGLRPTLLCVALLLTPESFLVLPGSGPVSRIDGPVKCVLLCALLLCALCFPFGPTLEESRRTRQPLFFALLPERRA